MFMTLLKTFTIIFNMTLQTARTIILQINTSHLITPLEKTQCIEININHALYTQYQKYLTKCIWKYHLNYRIRKSLLLMCNRNQTIQNPSLIGLNKIIHCYVYNKLEL